MKNLLLASVAILSLAVTPAFAQAVPDAAAAANAGAQSGSVSGALNNNSTTNGAQTTTVAPVSNGDSTALSGSNSGAAANQNQAQFNGGNTVGPIDSSVRVGPTTSTSNSDSGSVSGSNSVSRGGNATGGTGGTSGATATTGPSTATTGASTSSAQGGTGGSSSATANPNASNQGNAQNITFNSPAAPSKTKIESLPQVYAPALTTTLTETCMGSTSGGISVMGFGGTLGTTWNDKQCIRRLNAREMAQTLGDRDAARALMCQDEDIARAYASVGQDCREKWVQQVAVAPVQPPPPVVVNVPAPAAPQMLMAPVPNPPEPRIIYRDRPVHRAHPKPRPAAKCTVAPTACPAHDD